MNRLAVICGTGFEDLPLLEGAAAQSVVTPYGAAVVYCTALNGTELFFLPRHGKEHGLPPHLINYRANISALKQLEVAEVLAVFCVGSLRPEWGPGSLALCDQFIDQTWGRAATFSESGRVIHTDMSAPFCRRFNQRLRQAAEAAQLTLRQDATYICTQGPRLETAAEITAYRGWGADVVGMTAVPETPLAREAGLCYAGLAVVANYGAGMESSIDLAGISRVMRASQTHLAQLLRALTALPPEQRLCNCMAHGKDGGNGGK